jgi:hypothetical protein
MTHYNFHLSAAALADDDRRFKWETHFGGDFDLLDYVYGRTNVLIDYEAVLGNEFRPFDPYQSNYTLEASSSIRAGETEIAGVFHHLSRHLGDRPKRFAIAFNALGVRGLRRVPLGSGTLDVQASVGRILQHSYVDYTWTGDADAVLRRPVNGRVDVYGHLFGRVYGVNPAVAGRGTQSEGRVEGGVRLKGPAGAVEMFAAFERRIDADPIDRQPHEWALVGFRIVNK